mgnify:FL=1
MAHYLESVLACAHLNSTAASVVSQKGGSSNDAPMSREEIIALMSRLLRKQRLLKRVLRIDTKAKHKNLMWKLNRNLDSYRFSENPRAVIEYALLGRQCQILNAELNKMRLERKSANEAIDAAIAAAKENK